MTREMRDWFAVAAGPLAWFAALVASWILVPGAHEAGRLTTLRTIDAVALAIASVTGALALARFRALYRRPPADPSVQRARFLAASGVALSALSVVLLISLALPTFLLLPGAEP
jgi:hypothetical protein